MASAPTGTARRARARPNAPRKPRKRAPDWLPRRRPARVRAARALQTAPLLVTARRKTARLRTARRTTARWAALHLATACPRMEHPGTARARPLAGPLAWRACAHVPGMAQGVTGG